MVIDPSNNLSDHEKLEIKTNRTSLVMGAEIEKERLVHTDALPVN